MVFDMTAEAKPSPKRSASGRGTILPAGSGKMRHRVFPVSRAEGERLAENPPDDRPPGSKDRAKRA
jgi:hypothetical protein